jgi:polysaccharide export outer membrane protein
LPFLLCTEALAQSPASLHLALPEQPIGPNDLIGITTYGSPELTRTVRVSPDGYVQLPMLKERVRVAGLLPARVEADIAAALTREELIVDPVVTVHIVELHSRPISVSGAVRRPVTFQAAGRVTLLDALNRAEGLGPAAGPEILVTSAGGVENLVRRVPVKRLIDEADPEVNLLLTGGEEIRVPEMGKVYVIGNVRKPGAYPAAGSDDTTVLKMLAQAEGLAPFADRRAYVYRRDSDSGRKVEIAIELRRILSRQAPDVRLYADDILYVPDNSRRRLSITALERIIGFGSATASGVLIWGAAR